MSGEKPPLSAAQWEEHFLRHFGRPFFSKRRHQRFEEAFLANDLPADQLTLAGIGWQRALTVVLGAEEGAE